MAAPSHAAACGSGHIWRGSKNDGSVYETISIRVVNGHVADISGEIASSNCENLWLVNYKTGAWTAYLMHKPYQSAAYCTVNAARLPGNRANPASHAARSKPGTAAERHR
jgi:hypothetical protein